MNTTATLKKALSVILLVFGILVSSQTLNAQNTTQKNAIGIRFGYAPGITYKHYFANNGGVELILQTGYRGVLFTGLYEWHFPFPSAPGLFAYVGVGGHIGGYSRVWGYRKGRPGPYDDIYIYESRPSVGIDAIVGLEYRIPAVPITLGLDVKPSIDFYYRSAYGRYDGALSVRFRF